MRKDALGNLERSRANADGAGLFSTLARRRESNLLRLLVTYELMADFLDSADERCVFAGFENGDLLHGALVDALDDARTVADYFRGSPWRETNGYVQALVGACRGRFTALPTYALIQPLAIDTAGLVQVQSVNHVLDPARRDAALEQWAARRFPGEGELSWFELTGAASAWLGVLALLAIAAEPTVHERDGIEICDSYLWISLVGTMLDSFGDMGDDAARGDHSYIAHYPSEEIAAQRVSELLRRSVDEARRLRGGHRHAVIVACMTAMYLSKDSTRTPQMRARTATLIKAGGPLARLLVPVLRLWRVAYGQQSA